MSGTTVFNLEPHVSGFDRVLLRGQHEHWLTIVQGERESLKIQAPPGLRERLEVFVTGRQLTLGLRGGLMQRLADATATSLSRERITYQLTVTDLTALEIYGMAYVTAGKLRTPGLWLRFNGFGTVELCELDTHKLQVELLGNGRVEATGFSRDQNVIINGMGQYDAPGLQTYSAHVRMNGAGSATIWVQHELEAHLFGMGKLSYYGAPRYKRQRLAPMARVEQLGERGPMPEEQPVVV